MAQIEIVQTLPENEWRNFVNDHPEGNIFHTPEMFRVFSLTQGYQPELWAAAQNGRILALLLPVRVSMLRGFLRLMTTRSILFGSLLYAADGEGPQAMDQLLRAYQREIYKKALLTELRHQSDISAMGPILQDNGFIYEDHLNYMIDLDLPVERVWENVHKSARKSLTKASRKNALEIIDVTDDFQVAICYSLFKKTYAFAHVPLADFSLFKAAFDELYPKGMIKLLLGCRDGNFVAASAALLYKQTIYGWYRGFNRDYSASLPNDQMVWHMLKWGAENGYQVFNFGGAGKPSEPYGPRSFKAKFGGRLVNYGRHVSIHHTGLFRVSRLAYEIGRYIL